MSEPRAIPVAAVCDWLVAALAYGVDMVIMGNGQLPSGITRRDLAEAWTRINGDDTDDIEWALSVEGLN